MFNPIPDLYFFFIPSRFYWDHWDALTKPSDA